MSPLDWFVVLAALQREPCQYANNKPDQAFIARMLNRFAMDEPPPLSFGERRWLITLKRECKL